MNALAAMMICVAALSLAGCAAKDPTQIVLVIDSDISIPGELDRFTIKIERNGVVRTFLEYDLDPSHTASVKLPATLSLVADKDLAQQVTITVTGLYKTRELLVRQARLPFADNRVLMLRLDLLRKCAYRAKPCPPGTTCTKDGCKAIDVDPLTLPDYSKEQADKKLDAAAVKDASPKDAGPELGPDQGSDRGLDKGPKPDAPVPDASLPDSAIPDAPLPDAPLPDAPLPDAAPLDQAPDINPLCIHPTVTKNCTAGWCTIPAGCFMMGSLASEPCRNTNEDRRAVTLTHAFLISATEVTYGQFETEVGFRPWSSDWGNIPSLKKNDAVTNASWHDAAAYCNALSIKEKRNPCYINTGSNAACQTFGDPCSGNEYCFITSLTPGTQLMKTGECRSYAVHTNYSSGGKTIYHCPGYRLPTEAEWEYAYRAGTGSAFYNGPNTGGSACNTQDPKANPIAWYAASTYPDAGNSSVYTQRVGQKAANAWGLFDMAGNALEWAHDGYTASLGTASATDPLTPVSATAQVVRGGSVIHAPYALRAAARDSLNPAIWKANNGFRGLRCVRTLNPPLTGDTPPGLDK